MRPAINRQENAYRGRLDFRISILVNFTAYREIRFANDPKQGGRQIESLSVRFPLKYPIPYTKG